MNLNKRERRLKGLRKAKKILRIYRELDTNRLGEDFYSENGKILKKLLHTRVPCSCPMCGNPRRHRGEKTIQELKMAEEEQEELKIIEDMREE